MKRIVFLLLTLVFCLGLGLHDAEAKRLGGGKSSGMQRQSTPQREAAPQQQQGAQVNKQQPGAATAAQQQPQQSRWRSWLGPVAGLAAGLGLGALLSHFGMGAGASSFLMLLLLAGGGFLLLRWFLGRKAPVPQTVQYAGLGAHGAVTPTPGASVPPPPPAASPADATDTVAGTIPADFDTAAFNRQAKQHFIRMQAAFDAGDLEDLREFTSPEMYAEAKLELDERGGGKQRTEVVLLNAEVVDYARDERRVIVSVRFHGLLREDADEATAFDEIWHITRPLDNSQGWVVAGIQQPV
ncbi:MAG: hypothetical protein BWK76_26655 [Desulfobulbaceae bacterium A2]|nr:MAG: hypothetical protein BWK76_26655 [Desulfobulbaceae bacterium A2]